MSYDSELFFAQSAARKAGEACIRILNQGVEAETKSDESPVTRADKESERLIVSILSQAFPEDGFLGEEGASREGSSGRRWIIDPIDGTRDFVRNNRLWAILIGLEENGVPVVGVCYLPMLGEIYYAAKGHGAFWDGNPIQASKIDTAKQAVVCVNKLNAVTQAPFGPPLLDWMSKFWCVRVFGGIYDAMLVASGRMEIWLEPSVAPWDLCAPTCILREAGAKFMALNGKDSIYEGTGVAFAPGMESEVRGFLGL
ncbi:inositol monophosphatase family protein [Bryobacter aggregatus]|uniref:inositol monophosphatase family protein n=1 Tax=Bryobacter aggregatus TaxID=360054 RepID=UPI00068F92C6|nr:inositol monophosphatase family protein [Bryobacter aggregatus]